MDKTTFGTFLWIGDGGRPTFGVVEHWLRLLPATLPKQAATPAGPRPGPLYTVDRKPIMPWPYEKRWPRAGHIEADFLQWDPTSYRPYAAVFVDNILCWGHGTQSSDVMADTWESPLLHGHNRSRKLAMWTDRLLALAAPYVLTSGTEDVEDVEDGDVIPALTAYGYVLLASCVHDRKLHTGWYIWRRGLDHRSGHEVASTKSPGHAVPPTPATQVTLSRSKWLDVRFANTPPVHRQRP